MNNNILIERFNKNPEIQSVQVLLQERVPENVIFTKEKKEKIKAQKYKYYEEYAEEEILEKKLSPDAVCGYAKKNNLFENMVCTKTLYNYIELALVKIKNIDLPLRVKIT